MKIDLLKIAVYSTILILLIGSCISVYYTFLEPESFNGLTTQWGMIGFLFSGTFWFLIFCITPDKWWNK